MTDEQFDEYLKDRYQDQIDYYGSKAGWNKRTYNWFQWSVIIVSSILPVLVVSINEKYKLVAAGLSVVLAIGTSALKAFKFHDGFGVGVGTVVMVANAVLLTGFVFGCNSLRHLVGGGVDCFSCEMGGALKHQAWRGVTFFNVHHMGWAWFSMFSVGLTDLYIRLCSMGVIRDLRLL